MTTYTQIGTLTHRYQTEPSYSNKTDDTRRIIFNWTTGTSTDLITATQTLIGNLNDPDINSDGENWSYAKRCVGDPSTVCTDGYLKFRGATAVFGTTPVAPSELDPNPLYNGGPGQSPEDQSNWPPVGQGEIVNIPGLGNVKITTASTEEAVFSLEVQETAPDPPIETPEPEEETPTEAPTATPTQTATDCSAIPQECRITIPELTDATTSEDTDEFIVSRGGESFKLSMNEMIENIITDQRLLDKVTEIVTANQPEPTSTPPAEGNGGVSGQIHAFRGPNITSEGSYTYNYPAEWTGGLPDEVFVTTVYPSNDASSYSHIQLVSFDETSVTIYCQNYDTPGANVFANILLVKNSGGSSDSGGSSNSTSSIGGYIDVSNPGTTAFGAPTPYLNSRDSFTFPDFDNDTQVIFISYTVSEYVGNAADVPRGQLQPLQVGGNAFNVVPGSNITATLTAEGTVSLQTNTAGESTQWMAYRFTRAS